MVILFEYDGAYGAGDGLASMVNGRKCEPVDYGNRVIVPLEYDDISNCDEGALRMEYCISSQKLMNIWQRI